MEQTRFDTLTRNLAHGLTRRGAIAALAALTGAGRAISDDAEAKRKKKKVTLCRNRQTITVTKKKKQKHIQPGDTEGPCPPPSPPPGPPVGPPPGPPPTPRCAASKPNFCARLDACLEDCPAGKEFDSDSCACVCAQATTCCRCERGAEFLCFQNIAKSADCAAACFAAGGQQPGFLGADGSSAVCDFANDTCMTTCTAEPMTCPASSPLPTCEAGRSCCPAGAGVGCCFVDFPVCCGEICCLSGVDCCTNDTDCGAGRVCGKIQGKDGGCCGDAPDRSLGGRSVPMALAAPAVPKRDARAAGKERSRRKRRAHR